MKIVEYITLTGETKRAKFFHKQSALNDIVPMTGDHVFYKNKRNVFKIEELEGKYTIIRYRHQVPIGIYIKHILNYTVGWENIGSLHDEGISYFDSIEQAEEYISYVLI